VNRNGKVGQTMGLDVVIGNARLDRETVKGHDGIERSVADFAIVADGKRSWIGVIAGQNDAGQVMLSPAYAYIEEWMIQPNGTIPRVRAIVPIDAIVSATTIEVRAVSILLLSQLDAGDREFYAKLLRDAEEQRSRLRAGRSGLTLETSLPSASAR